MTLGSATGVRAIPFCHPYGSAEPHNADTIAALDEAGYDLAFSVERRDVVFGTDTRFELPRLDTRDMPPFVAEAAVA